MSSKVRKREEECVSKAYKTSINSREFTNNNPSNTKLIYKVGSNHSSPRRNINIFAK